MNSRENSLENFYLEDWIWQPFLQKTIRSFAELSPKLLPTSKEYLDKEVTIGSRNKSIIARSYLWACQTRKIRKVRAACISAGRIASVMNLLACPFDNYDLPFFGADFVTLQAFHLVALDLQPVIKNDRIHTKHVWERLEPIHKKWQSLLPKTESIPNQFESYFSPFLLWSKIPLGNEEDYFIKDVLFNAYSDYLDLYMQIVLEASEVCSDRSRILKEGQEKYMSYRAVKDPARSMLIKLFGEKWTESYIRDVLFDI
tara:strand:+ start:149 stop:919 length:771 start_codon:yes stop_codon:yes gene_type:complete